MSHTAAFFLLVLAPGLALVLALLGLETLKDNIHGWLLLAFGIGYPAVAIAYFWILKRPSWEGKEGSRGSVTAPNDKSFWLILPGMVATFLGPPLDYLYLPAILPRTGWMQLIGVVFILVGVALGLWTRSAIMVQHAGPPAVLAKQQLVESGPYRHIRHPDYAAGLLMALGICLGYSSLVGMAAVPALLVPGLAYRMHVDESLLARSFGDIYKAYACRTKRILPGIW